MRFAIAIMLYTHVVFFVGLGKGWEETAPHGEWVQGTQPPAIDIVVHDICSWYNHSAWEHPMLSLSYAPWRLGEVIIPLTTY